MSPEIFLIISILLPVVLGVGLRINAAVLFMSLCVGEVLVQYVAGSALSFTGNISSLSGSFNESTLNLVLLLLPAVLTAAVMFHSVTGKRAMLNILPAIATGFLVAILAEPLLDNATQRSITHSWLWQRIVSAETPIIAAGAFVALVFLWVQHRVPSSRGRSHKGKHHASSN